MTGSIPVSRKKPGGSLWTVKLYISYFAPSDALRLVILASVRPKNEVVLVREVNRAAHVGVGKFSLAVSPDDDYAHLVRLQPETAVVGPAEMAIENLLRRLLIHAPLAYRTIHRSVCHREVGEPKPTCG